MADTFGATGKPRILFQNLVLEFSTDVNFSQKQHLSERPICKQMSPDMRAWLITPDWITNGDKGVVHTRYL